MTDRPVILVVDDRPENLLSIEAVLEPLDVAVHTALRAESALQLLLQMEVAMILLDVEMPGMDGFETARMIRQRPRSRETPIIFITAVDRGSAAVREGYELGAVDYITKPFQPDILRWKVSVFAELYRSRQKERLLVEEQTRRLELEAAMRRTKFLADVSGILASSMDEAVILPRLIQRFVPDFADLAVIFRRETARALRVEAASEYPEGGIRDNALLDVRQGDPLLACMDDGVPLLIEDLARTDFRSGVFLPIRVPNRSTALLALYKREAQEFGSAEQAFARDLMDRIQLSLTNVELFQESNRANQAKDEFLAIVSHELRTPLVTITGWAHLLLSKDLPAERVDKALRTIQKSASMEAELITDILDFSRIAAGKFSISLQNANVRAILEQTVEALRPGAEAKCIRLVPEFGDEAVFVQADPKRLQQVFSNLVSNAIKFTPEEGSVAIRLADLPDTVQIQIQDTGIGIQPDILPRVFEPFMQGDSSSTRAYSGLGLGLAIAHRLARLHGGEIMAESNGHGRGSTFTVKLPKKFAQPRAS